MLDSISYSTLEMFSSLEKDEQIEISDSLDMFSPEMQTLILPYLSFSRMTLYTWKPKAESPWFCDSLGNCTTIREPQTIYSVGRCVLCSWVCTKKCCCSFWCFCTYPIALLLQCFIECCSDCRMNCCGQTCVLYKRQGRFYHPTFWNCCDTVNHRYCTNTTFCENRECLDPFQQISVPQEQIMVD